MQPSANSSIPPLPPLPLSDHEDRPPITTALKQRASSRFSIKDMLELPVICEELSDRSSTGMVFADAGKELITLKQIQTLRALNLPVLEEMTEE